MIQNLLQRSVSDHLEILRIRVAWIQEFEIQSRQRWIAKLVYCASHIWYSAEYCGPIPKWSELAVLNKCPELRNQPSALAVQSLLLQRANNTSYGNHPRCGLHSQLRRHYCFLQQALPRLPLHGVLTTAACRLPQRREAIPSRKSTQQHYLTHCANDER